MVPAAFRGAGGRRLDAEILTQRAEIARAIEGQTICGLLERAARQFARRPALSQPAAPVTPASRNGTGRAQPSRTAVAGRP